MIHGFPVSGYVIFAYGALVKRVKWALAGNIRKVWSGEGMRTWASVLPACGWALGVRAPSEVHGAVMSPQVGAAHDATVLRRGVLFPLQSAAMPRPEGSRPALRFCRWLRRRLREPLARDR